MKIKNNTILLLLATMFFSLFIYNGEIRLSIIDSINTWMYTVVPSILPMYILVDMMLNYGLSNELFRLFKSNIPLLTIVSLVLGCPSNAKYIKDYYSNVLISKSDAEYLLTFSYSPSPLFIFGMASNESTAIKTLITIYVCNLMVALLFYKKHHKNEKKQKIIGQKNFTGVLEKSIYDSFKVLVLILGVIVVFGLMCTLVDIYIGKYGVILKSILEITNALRAVSDNISLFILASCFGGISIHMQVKSILMDTDIDYKYFLYGRVISCLLAFFITHFY